MSHAIDGSVPYDLAGRLRSQEETKAWLEERANGDSKMNKICNELIERCAKVAEDAIPSIQMYYGAAETVGAHIVARCIRELKQ